MRFDVSLVPDSVMGPTGMPKALIALSMEGRSTPSCTRAVTSTMKGARQRLTKKPADTIEIPLFEAQIQLR